GAGAPGVLYRPPTPPASATTTRGAAASGRYSTFSRLLSDTERPGLTRTRAIPPPPTAEHPADRAVRLRDRAGLSADRHVALDAVLAGFARYEAGDDAGAREALQAVGLQSPFLEWKLLLRGLIAYSAGDDARAVENWQRLGPNRLPARLAAPVRAALDRPFADAQPAAAL